MGRSGWELDLLERSPPGCPEAGSSQLAESFHAELLEAQRRTECLMTSFKYSDISVMKGLNATVPGPVILKTGIMTSALNSVCLSGTFSS